MKIQNALFTLIALLIALISVGGVVGGGIYFILGDNFGGVVAAVSGFLGFAFYNVYSDRKVAQAARARNVAFLNTIK